MITGINLSTENFPDKDFLILGIATFTAGEDEIFSKNYVPKPEELRRQPVNDLMIDNSDGLFDNVDHLLPKNKKGRRLNLTSFTVNDKLNVKVLKK